MTEMAIAAMGAGAAVAAAHAIAAAGRRRRPPQAHVHQRPARHVARHMRPTPLDHRGHIR